MTYRLDPGKSYSLRYDEDDKIDLYLGSHGRTGAVDLAPFVATPMSVVNKMLRLAQIDESDVVYDLGCGDGRILMTAAKKYGARGVGIELDPQLIRRCRMAAMKAGVQHLLRFRMEDATKTDISEATLVSLYLLTESNELLRAKLNRELRRGTCVVSHNYPIPGWESKEITSVIGKTHDIYLYRR